MTPFSHVLVTGGAGFIGSHLVPRLLADGVRVTVLDDLSTGKEENIPAGARFIRGDVRSPEAVAEALSQGVDGVIHLAARVTIRGSADGFVPDADVNILGTLNLLQAVRGRPLHKFVFASSMAVYGDAPDPTPVSEAFTIAPASPYGVSKYAGELYTRLLCAAAGIPWAVVRYFNTYGPNQGFTPYVGVVTIFITRLLRGEPLTLFGDGNQCRDFVHVDNIVQGTLLALGSPRPEGVWNLGTGHGHTVNDIVTVLSRCLGVSPVVQYQPRREEELIHSVADVRRAGAELGYEPRRLFPDGLEAVIEHIRAAR